MEFCPKCEALLLPKKVGNKVILFCKKCGFESEAKEGVDYKLVVNIPHTEKDKIDVIKLSVKKRVSEEEREAFEDYYRGIEEVGEEIEEEEGGESEEEDYD
ncbi:MAG: DNA-directed RNA polymerase subunit M [Candidatus Odinarchaeum yellowstonii]|uniref:DNA-directed RNA polymerase subunit M n=1 Tax=Odinarchaeota yellowstonii (strain LCB_4) TaxID=1841599 RepID=A0AAF0D1I5_ODILC|nr:MAG: DNA-directed RNA polymerase subunit M [Candidatus Odinarchaeum yellowstonii]